MRRAATAAWCGGYGLSSRSPENLIKPMYGQGLHAVHGPGGDERHPLFQAFVREGKDLRPLNPMGASHRADELGHDQRVL